uniref:PPPDE domain-containing protein n=1 Tax=Trichobilharzia regenti TaxID=157069 RepID=A0AA85IVY9_TRIRE|nr:unnamed protein product [Trichobilharzia regenti]
MSDVYLYIYDLSGGLARILSPQLLGKQIEGIWHTAAVLYNKEFFFCQSGIQYCEPCTTTLGSPLEKRFMGRTHLTESEIFRYLEQLSGTLFKPGDYNLFEHNCNTFSNHFINHLTSTNIPSYILNLPREVMSTPFGASIGSAMNSLSVGINSKSSIQSIQQSANTKNRHSYNYIRKHFRPIFFDEPVSSELLPHRLYLLWPADDNSVLATLAAKLSEALLQEKSEIQCAQECSILLALDQLTTGDQCRASCELFRLAVWKDPNILMNLLTDPRRYLHKLSQVQIPFVKTNEFYDIEASLAKLLCNCLGLSADWAIMKDDDMKLDINSIIEISLTLLNDDIGGCLTDGSSSRRSSIASIASSVNNCCTRNLLSEHKLVGLALAHNISLYPSLTENDALTLGSFLLHLASTGKKSYKYPMEGIYLTRTIYFLTVRFSSLSDLAKCCDIHNFLQEIMDESNRVNSSTTSTSTTTTASTTKTPTTSMSSSPSPSSHNQIISSSTEKIQPGVEVDSLTSADYLIASQLLDFLSNNYKSDDS